MSIRGTVEIIETGVKESVETMQAVYHAKLKGCLDAVELLRHQSLPGTEAVGSDFGDEAALFNSHGFTISKEDILDLITISIAFSAHLAFQES